MLCGFSVQGVQGKSPILYIFSFYIVKYRKNTENKLYIEKGFVHEQLEHGLQSIENTMFFTVQDDSIRLVSIDNFRSFQAILNVGNQNFP